MSAEDEDKVVGRLVKEHQKAKREAHLCRERLRNLGRSLLTIAGQLSQEQFETADQNLSMFVSDAVDLSAVRNLIHEQNEAAVKARQLAGRLLDLGIAV